MKELESNPNFATKIRRILNKSFLLSEPQPFWTSTRDSYKLFPTESLGFFYFLRWLKGFFFFFFNSDITDIWHYISFRYTTKWFDICVDCKMITIGLVNIRIHSYKFFPVMRNIKIHSINNYQIFNTVLLTIVMLYIILPGGIYL